MTDRHSKESMGFGMVELIVAIGIWIVLVASGTVFVLGGFEVNRLADEQNKASSLAQEGLEAGYSIKKQGWNTPFLATNCITGCGVGNVSNTWGYLGSNNVFDKYTRQVFITPVSRDSTGNIVSSGGTDDPNTKKITSTVTWNFSPLRNEKISLINYVTNYAKRIIGNWSLPLVDSSYNLPGNENVIGLALSGKYLYVLRPSNSNDISVFDVSNTSSPVLVGALAITGTTATGIVTDGTYLYISDANNTSELKIIDVSNPTSPVLITSYDVPGNSNANGLFQSGNYVYLVRSRSGSGTEFVVIDVTNKLSPTTVGTLSLSGSGNQVTVMGNYAYIADADSSAELQIVDISNPTAPVLTGTLNLPGTSSALSIAGFGTTVMVGRTGGSMNIVDISNPVSPLLLSTYAGSGGNINSISLGNYNQYAFLATTSTSQQFQVVDVSNLSSPTLLGFMNMAAGLNWVIYDQNTDRAFLGSMDNANEIFILKPS